MTKKIVKNQILRERRTSLFTEKGLNDIPVQKDKVQQDSNKKIENERPKASGTLKVENSPPTIKKVENNHKEQPKHKDEKSKRKRKK